MGDQAPRFTGLNFVAEDYEATLGFYRLLGVEVPEDTIWRSASGAHHSSGVEIGSAAEVEFDSPALARVYNAGYRENPSSPATIFGFALATREAVDELHAKLTAAGHPSRQAPCDAFWGARFAVVADPDGRDVGLMSPRDPSKNSSPPDL